MFIKNLKFTENFLLVSQLKMSSPKRIIVVGASSGIGAEIAKQYALQKSK